MAELLIFHHAQGLMPGVLAFAERMRVAGHEAHVPDLYDGRTFDSLDAGIAFAQETGLDTIVGRGRAASEDLPAVSYDPEAAGQAEARVLERLG